MVVKERSQMLIRCAITRSWSWSIAGLLMASSVSSLALAQFDCPTNFCIKSQSLSYQPPPGWPHVAIAPCCKVDWGTLPGEIDWTNAKPIILCTGDAEYATTFPNCGGPNNLSQAFPLTYSRPKVGIGVAWPNPRNYSMESIPIIDGADGSCAKFSNSPGKAAKWWIYELTDPQRGSYVFTATVSFHLGEKGYVAVLDNCKLAMPSSAAAKR
jgi:hypothetical protein